MGLSVAFIIGKFPVLSQTFVFNQAAGLIDRGHDVRILSLSEPPPPSPKMHSIVERYRLVERTTYLPRPPHSIVARVASLLPSVLKEGAAGWSLLARSLDIRRYGKNAISLRRFFEAAPLLRIRTPDVVHCQFGTLGISAVRLRQLGVLDAPIVTAFRGFDASRHVQQHGAGVYRDLFVHGDMFLPNCDFFRHRLIDLGCDADRIAVLRSGIDCRRFVPRTQSSSTTGEVRITSVGRLVEKKGFRYAIAAIDDLRRRHPNIRLQIVGDGPLRPELEREIAHRKLGSHVRMLGELSQEELVSVLMDTDFLLAPSVRATDGDEDAPVNTLKEAMAMGIPVIGTHHGGISELVEEGVSGHLVPPGDASAIAIATERLLAQRHRWPEMGRAGRRRVLEEYDIERQTDRLVAIYQEVIERRKGSRGNQRRPLSRRPGEPAIQRPGARPVSRGESVPSLCAFAETNL